MDNLSKNKIKEIRSLQQKKFRDELGLFIIEGVKMVEEAIAQNPDLIDCCIHTSDYIPSKQTDSFPFYRVDSKTLGQCSGLKTPNHVLLVIRKLSQKKQKADFILALDGIQDPGNFGTILRLADWFGIDQIICSNETVDVYNPKVVQASMGAILRISVEYRSLQDYFEENKSSVFGALLEGKNVYQENLIKKGVLLMGNEGNGISQHLLKYITNPISIPKFGQAESLNVSVATGILLSEFSRS